MKTIVSFKRILCFGFAVANLAVASPALADPPGNWGGTYVGGFGGMNWTDFDHNAGSDSDIMFGGDVGHNWQYDHMILGLEGDFSKFDTHAGNNGVKFSEDWMSTARARAGYGLGRFMPYVTGGLAMTDTTYKVSGVGRDEEIEPGYAVGGGVDAMLTDNWFGRVEYLFDNVPRDATTIGNTLVSGGSSDNTLKVGVNYKF